MLCTLIKLRVIDIILCALQLHSRSTGVLRGIAIDYTRILNHMYVRLQGGWGMRNLASATRVITINNE